MCKVRFLLTLMIASLFASVSAMAIEPSILSGRIIAGTKNMVSANGQSAIVERTLHLQDSSHPEVFFELEIADPQLAEQLEPSRLVTIASLPNGRKQRVIAVLNSLDASQSLSASATDTTLNFYACPGMSDTPEQSPQAGEGLEEASHPLSALPLLHSLPGAAQTLFLDFDGHFEASWGSFSNVDTPVYDQDGDRTTFSDAELASITEIWQRVSEDYAPLRIDVTTEDPGDFSNGRALRVAIGGSSSDWYGASAGGVCYLNNFTNFIANTCYVFPQQLANGTARFVGEASSHEAGHGFGLLHQSSYDANGVKTNEYNRGTPDWAPIMGNSYYANRSTWHNGTTTSASTFQDDFALLSRSTNVFGFRPDDHASSQSGATPFLVNAGHISEVGIIETMPDQDFFSFTAGAGPANFTLDPRRFGANPPSLVINLDSIMELRRSDGTVLASSAPSDSSGANLSTTLQAGNYHLMVKSTEAYGYIGSYTITGNITTASAAPTPTTTATSTATATRTSTPTVTATPTATRTATSTATAIATATRTATATATATRTQTSTPTRTSTPTLTPLITSTSTPTPTRTSTATVTPFITSTSTPTATRTVTRTATSTATATATRTMTGTSTRTATPTQTSNVQQTPTATRTQTPTHTSTSTPVSVNTVTPTATVTATATATIDDRIPKTNCGKREFNLKKSQFVIEESKITASDGLEVGELWNGSTALRVKRKSKHGDTIVYNLKVSRLGKARIVVQENGNRYRRVLAQGEEVALIRTPAALRGLYVLSQESLLGVRARGSTLKTRKLSAVLPVKCQQ